MNEQISFDVFEYSIHELEHLLKLKPKYLIGEIEKYKDLQIEKILETNCSEKMKKKVVHFMNEISLILKFNYQNLNYNITYPTKIVESNLNQLKVQTLTKTLSFNTLFRNNNLKTSSISTDCEFILPLTVKNVISLKLSSLEFPCSYYTISDSLKNNILYIKEDTTNIEGNVVLPEGNYTSGSLLADELQNAIAQALGTDGRFNVSFDEIKGKITINNSTNTFTVNLIVSHVTMKLYNTFGWLLGFRKPTYS